MADPGVPEFHWADYLVFVLTLVLSGAIGVYYAINARLRRSGSAADVLLGGRKMSVFPVALSLMASFLSAILVLGVPSDTFAHDTMYLLIAFSNFLTFPVAAHAFLPVFRRSRGMTSAYEVGAGMRPVKWVVLGCWHEASEVGGVWVLAWGQ